MKSACAAANTNESRPSQPVTPAQAGVHHEPLGKLEHGAEDRDRLLRTKCPSPINTMDPGFRRGDGGGVELGCSNHPRGSANAEGEIHSRPHP